MAAFQSAMEALIDDGVLEFAKDTTVIKMLSWYRISDIQPPFDLLAAATQRGLIINP